MKKMNATEFKAKCLKELDNLPDEGIILTKHGKPIAKVIPIKKKNMMDYYGCMKGQIKILGNVFSTGEKWNAES